MIVNADDFGLTRGVNRAVVELHEAGVLTSATLMAKAEATEEAIELALANPRLGVGCHVVLVDGEPKLDPGELARLTSGGSFRPKLGSFLGNVYGRPGSGARLAAEMEAEAYAQITSLQARGLRLTHVDTHKHTHMFPAVLRAVLRAARRAGIGAIRNPFEPGWAVEATPGAPWLRRTQVNLLRTLAGRFRALVAEHGLRTTDGAIGVLATGTLDGATVRALLAAATGGTWELVTHPGYNDGDLARARTRLLGSRERERQALAEVAGVEGLQLIHFGEVARDSEQG